jgi:sarcosine oxidase subunit gamma
VPELFSRSPLYEFADANGAARIAGERLVVAERQGVEKLILRGDRNDLESSARHHVGIEIPARPNSLAIASDGRICLWQKPDQWMLLLPGRRFSPEQQALRTALGAGRVFDVSARFVQLQLQGADAPALLATGCGVDLRPARFGDGQCAGTRIEQVPVCIFRVSEESGYQLLVESPLAHHLWQWLLSASREFACLPQHLLHGFAGEGSTRSPTSAPTSSDASQLDVKRA